MKKYESVLLCFLAVVMLLCACSREKPEESLQTDGTTAVTTVIPEDMTGSETTVGEKEVVFISGDRLVYSNLQDLTDRAEWIVRGTVVAQRCEWRPIAPAEPEHGNSLFTVTTFQVEEVYKGEITYETIEILEEGGETDTVIYDVKGFADFEMNLPYIVFLRTSLSNDYTGVLMSHIQGRYLLENGEPVADIDEENISGINFTLAELKTLPEQQAE